MSNFNIGLQEAKGGYRVVLYSRDNGKLVLAGEVIKAMQDAMDTEEALMDAWNSKANRVERTDAIIPKGHKWPKNAGPKKKAAKVAKKKAAKKMARSHVEAYVEGHGLTKAPRKVLADPDFLRKKAAKKKP